MFILYLISLIIYLLNILYFDNILLYLPIIISLFYIIKSLNLVATILLYIIINFLIIIYPTPQIYLICYIFNLIFICVFYNKYTDEINKCLIILIMYMYYIK